MIGSTTIARFGLAALILLPALPAASVAGGTEAPERHFELDRSAPMADSTVAPTTEVRLWFTQAPQEGATRIRVTKRDVPVPAGEVTPHPDDPTQHAVTFEAPLSPGTYKVLWRSMAADGHVVDGEFGFEVAAPGHISGGAVSDPASSRR